MKTYANIIIKGSFDQLHVSCIHTSLRHPSHRDICVAHYKWFSVNAITCKLNIVIMRCRHMGEGYRWSRSQNCFLFKGFVCATCASAMVRQLSMFKWVWWQFCDSIVMDGEHIRRRKKYNTDSTTNKNVLYFDQFIGPLTRPCITHPTTATTTVNTYTRCTMSPFKIEDMFSLGAMSNVHGVVFQAEQEK